jgi:hypothetical protein
MLQHLPSDVKRVIRSQKYIAGSHFLDRREEIAAESTN